jgi:hypothetical protein
VAAGVGTVLLIVLLGTRFGVSYRTPLSACVEDAGTGGGLGLVRWARLLGFGVRGLDEPLWEAPAGLQRPTGNCLLTAGNGPWSPLWEGMDDEDWRGLRGWLSGGNVLIVVTTEPGALPESFRQDLVQPVLQVAGGERPTEPTLGLNSVNAKPETTVLPVSGGGSLTVTADGPRWKQVGGRRGGIGPRWRRLAGDGRGGVLWRTPLGDGAVYVLLDGFAWTNAGLDQDGNADVLAGILGREVHGGVLGVDEYRHGHGRAESFVTYLGNVPGAALALAVAGVWGVFYLYGRNVRLRPAEEYAPAERRTAREYVDALAQLQERARAAPLVVEAVSGRLRHLARGPAGLPPAAEALLARAGRYVAEAPRPAQPGEALGLVVELVRTRKELYGSRTIP